MKISVFILFLVFSFVSFAQNTDELEKKVYEKIKAYKKKFKNYQNLVLESSMSSSCREHSEKMCLEDNLEHISSFDGVEGNSEIIQYVSSFNIDLEKLSQRILTNFLNSPPHKSIIENPSTHIGVGIHIKSIKEGTDEDAQISYEIWTTIRFY